jgi:hypothetical protein
MVINHESGIAATFSEKARAAREHLWSLMEASGLNAKGGWRIAESVRPVAGGSELVLRPLHMYLDAPSDMECVVWIDGGGTQVEMECTS